jgi:hypothetical protein
MEQFLQTLNLTNPQEDNLFILHPLFDHGLTDEEKDNLVNLPAVLCDAEGRKTPNLDLIKGDHGRIFTLMALVKTISELGFKLESDFDSSDYVIGMLPFAEDCTMFVSCEPLPSKIVYRIDIHDDRIIEKARPHHFDVMSMEDRLTWSMEFETPSTNGSVEVGRGAEGLSLFITSIRDLWVKYQKALKSP